MQMTVDEFESVTNEAFSFLISDFGYSANPPKRGGHFGSSLIREFVKGDLRIQFIFGDSEQKKLDIGRPIGIFSSLELVEKAILNRHEQMGAHERLEGYEVWRMDIAVGRDHEA